MVDQHCRITVIGQHRQADLAVPALAPIGEYVGGLAGLCQNDEDDALPAAWTLAEHGRTLAPTMSLAEAGIVDGQVLHLRDVTLGEYDEPVVLDVAELVDQAAEQIGGPRWDNPVRAAMAVTVGAAWLVLAPLAAMLGGASGGLPGFLALVAGLLLPLLAWTARRSGWPVGPVPQQFLALGAVPALAVAVRLLLPGTAPGLVPVMVALGALVGALAALVAIPRVAVLAVLVVLVVGTLVVAVLTWLSATAVEIDATVALVGYALLVLAPWVVGHLIALWPGERRPTSDTDADAATRADVLHGRYLLIVWTAVVAALLTVVLAPLAIVGNGYAVALSGCLCVALLRRAGGYQLLLEAAPVVVAGAAGLFTALVRLPGLLPQLPPSFGTVFTWLLGSLAVLAGLAMTFRRDREPAPSQRWLRVIAATCVVATIPLLLGVYGLFDQLLALGRTM